MKVDVRIHSEHSSLSSDSAHFITFFYRSFFFALLVMTYLPLAFPYVAVTSAAGVTAQQHSTQSLTSHDTC